MSRKLSVLRLSKRARAIEPFHVMRILAEARQLEAQGRSIIHMEIGEPDFPSPEPVIAAGKQALNDRLTHYTAANGLPALRKAIAAQYRLDPELNADRVLVTPGSSGALQLVMALLLNSGDGIMLADPGYPCNRHIASLFYFLSIFSRLGNHFRCHVHSDDSSGFAHFPGR